MTKLLENAIEAVRRLSPERQDEIARAILTFAGEDDRDRTSWLAENRRAIEAYNTRVADSVILSDLDRAF